MVSKQKISFYLMVAIRTIRMWNVRISLLERRKYNWSNGEPVIK